MLPEGRDPAGVVAEPVQQVALSRREFIHETRRPMYKLQQRSILTKMRHFTCFHPYKTTDLWTSICMNEINIVSK